MRIVWWPEARRDFDRIDTRLRNLSEASADRFARRVFDRVGMLAQFPLLGPATPEHDTPSLRQLSLGDYRIIYLVEFDQIEILALVHGAMDLRASED